MPGRDRPHSVVEHLVDDFSSERLVGHRLSNARAYSVSNAVCSRGDGSLTSMPGLKATIANVLGADVRSPGQC